MARGWESKGVEAQIESARTEVRLSQSAAASLSPDHIRREREQESLRLSRTRILHDLDAARHPRHRVQLQAALRHLEEKLSALG